MAGMNKLASNYTVYRIFISPRDIENDEQAELISKGLSDILGVDRDRIRTLTKKVHRADETVMKELPTSRLTLSESLSSTTV